MQLKSQNAPASLQTNIIYLCGDFSHVFHQALTRAFKRNGITVTLEQFAVLAILFYHNGINQKEIGWLLHRDKTTIARVVANMIRRKVIRRVADKRDSRAKLIFLTARGEAIQKKAVKVSGELYQKALAGIQEPDLARGVRLIAMMTKNIQDSFSKR
jgi:MarR family transcriptional regulator, organic hydroperoxide resistance regulator